MPPEGHSPWLIMEACLLLPGTADRIPKVGRRDSGGHRDVVVWYLFKGTYFLESNAMLVVYFTQDLHDKIWIK